MEKDSRNILSEVQKIRHFVMNLIYHNGNHSVKIPSSRELAEEFGVARSTVRIALEKMTEESYLITRKGIGTFTNPLMAFASGNSPALLGIKLFRGDQFYFDAPLMRTVSQLFWSFAAKNFNVRLLNAGCSTADDFKLELENSYVDAVICYGTNAEFLEAATHKLPSLGIDCKGKNSSYIEFDPVPAAKTLAEELLKLSRKPKILWMHGDLCEDFRSALVKIPELEFIPTENNLDSLNFIPDAIITTADQLEQIHQTLSDRNIGLERCRLISSTMSSSETIPYLLLESPRREACDLAADLMKNLLRNPEKTLRRTLPYTLLPMNMPCKKIKISAPYDK